jgi:hypothetical protein
MLAQITLVAQPTLTWTIVQVFTYAIRARRPIADRSPAIIEREGVRTVTVIIAMATDLLAPPTV